MAKGLARAFCGIICVVVVFALPASGDIIQSGSMIADVDEYGYVAHLTHDDEVAHHVYEMYAYIGNSIGTIPIAPPYFDIVQPLTDTGGYWWSAVELNATGAVELGLIAGDLLVEWQYDLDEAPNSMWYDFIVTNNSEDLIDLKTYRYADFDIYNGPAYDYALGGVAGMTFTDDPYQLTWTPVGDNADHFDLDEWNIVQDNLDSMGPAVDLDDTVISFGPGDVTAAMQLDLSILPFTGLGVYTDITIVPEPGTFALLAIGVAGIAAYRGRNRRGKGK